MPSCGQHVMEPAMSSGCHVKVSPRGCAVELTAMKVRFLKSLSGVLENLRLWARVRCYVGEAGKSSLPVASSLLTTFPKCVLSYFCTNSPPFAFAWTKAWMGRALCGLAEPGGKKDGDLGWWGHRSLSHRFLNPLLLLILKKPGRKFCDVNIHFCPVCGLHCATWRWAVNENGSLSKHFYLVQIIP